MTEQQEKIQDLLDDFIGRNHFEIERAANENPLLLKSVLDVVEIISKKYGSGKAPEVKVEEPVEEKSEEVVTTEADVPQETKVETVAEIKEEEEQLSAEDIKTAIKNLKPLAEFDEDVKKEIELLKLKLKGIKTKKS